MKIYLVQIWWIDNESISHFLFSRYDKAVEKYEEMIERCIYDDSIEISLYELKPKDGRYSINKTLRRFNKD